MNTEKKPRWDIFPSYEDQFSLAATELAIALPGAVISPLLQNEQLTLAFIAMSLHGAFGFIHAAHILRSRNNKNKS